MSLSSIVFIFGFLPVTLVIYHVIPLFMPRFHVSVKNIILLIASLFFYCWGGTEYLPLFLLLILFNYSVALIVDRLQSGMGAKLILALGIIVDVLVLVYYKYLGFLGSVFGNIIDFGFTETSIIQPLGISFFTFSVISYLVDVYRGKTRANKNLLQVAVWISFFPKIISGPIVRYEDMEEELVDRRTTLPTIAYGARRFVIGLAKKVILADTFGVLADEIFALQSSGIDTPTAWLGIICYTLQIFFDFAGYSDMAIGLAAFFGFRFKENFDYPYISRSLGEFWRRWHISLSTWLRDYIYFPLGGSRRGNVYVNLFIVFLISGIWHGASWHFVAWGMWHGVFMIVDRLCVKSRLSEKIPAAVQWLVTIFIVILGWVFFRAESMTEALSYLMLLFGIGSVDTQFFSFMYYLDHRMIFLLIAGAACSTPLFAKVSRRFEGGILFETTRSIGMIMLFAVTIMFAVNSSYSPFLYAQF